jgi:hypothetical protein
LQRRLITLLVAVTVFVSTVPGQTLGRELPTNPGAEVIRLLFGGRNIDAAELAIEYAERAPLAERQSAFRSAAQTCITAMDVACARVVANSGAAFLNTMTASELQQHSLGYVVLLEGFLHVMAGNLDAKISGPGFPNPLVNPINEPVLFAELHLLAAKQARLLLDFEASRENLDKAIAITLSLEFERFDASRLLVRIAAQLLENYEVERAARLVFAALPLLTTIPPDSFLAYELVQVFNALAGYRKGFDVLADGLRNQIAKLDQLQLAPTLASSLKAAASNDLLGVEALRGDNEALRKLLQAHPLAAAKPAILKRGYFVDANEFNFALAEEFARLILQDTTDTGWRDLMKMPPRWTKDPERVREVQMFGQAAVGLQLLKANKTEARRE